MTFEKSCGAVVFTRIRGEIRYILAQAIGGHFGFPKGHMEPGETEEETALREIFEEVRIRPMLLDGFREISEYYIPDVDVQKQVVFFLAEYADQEIVFQKEELQNAPLVPYDAAMELLTHAESKRILTAAHNFLSREEENTTLNWYHENADVFITRTSGVDMSALYDVFLAYVAPGGKIMDLGCGAGKASRYFVQHGFDAVPIDGCRELCDATTKLTGCPARNILFAQLDYSCEFDGIWACASAFSASSCCMFPKGKWHRF